MRPPTGLALVPAVAVPAQAVGKEEGLHCCTLSLAGVQQRQGLMKRRRRVRPFRGWTIREKAHSRGIYIWDEPEPGPALYSIADVPASSRCGQMWEAGGRACRGSEVRSCSFGRLLPGSDFVHGFWPTVGRQAERLQLCVCSSPRPHLGFKFLGIDLWSDGHQPPCGTPLQGMKTLSSCASTAVQWL